MSRSRTIKDVTEQNVEQIARMQLAETHERTYGQWLADRLVTWVGSWTFLIVQSVLLGIWMILNLVGLWSHWDPYPFVLLNLVLSFQAAFSSPVILMSENRQARLSERRNHLDLQVNLLAEQENTEQLRLLEMICRKLEIPLKDSELRPLEEVTVPEDIVDQITRNVEPKSDP